MFVVALPPDATGTRRSSSSRRVARLKRAFGVLLVLAALVFVIDELIEQTGIVPQMEMSETSAAAGGGGGGGATTTVGRAVGSQMPGNAADALSSSSRYSTTTTTTSSSSSGLYNSHDHHSHDTHVD